MKTLYKITLVAVLVVLPLSAFAAAPTITFLTDIPAFTSMTNASDLPAFLNSLYKICIGAAVVIAILQLIRGGITWMLADSMTSKESAKHSITIAIMGLILVLSPYIVFSIINPKILELSPALDIKLDPLSQPQIVPTGGVDIVNTGTYINAKRFASTDSTGQSEYTDLCNSREGTRARSVFSGQNEVTIFCMKELGEVRMAKMCEETGSIVGGGCKVVGNFYPTPKDNNKILMYEGECRAVGLGLTGGSGDNYYTWLDYGECTPEDTLTPEGNLRWNGKRYYCATVAIKGCDVPN